MKRRRTPLLTRWYSPRIQRALRKGNTKRARRLARLWTHFWPGDPNAWYTFINLLKHQHDTEGVEKALREAVLRHAWAPWFRFTLVERFIEADRWEDARQVAEDLAKAQPKSPLSANSLALLAWHDDDRDEYMRQVLQAVDLLEASTPPWDDDTVGRVAYALVFLPETRDRAVALLHRFVDEDDSPLPRMLLAVLIENAEGEASRQLLQQARSTVRDDDYFDRVAGQMRESCSQASYWTEDEETVDA